MKTIKVTVTEHHWYSRYIEVSDDFDHTDSEKLDELYEDGFDGIDDVNRSTEGEVTERWIVAEKVTP